MALHFIPVLAAASTIAVPGGGLFRAKSGRHQQRLLDHDASNDIKSKLHESNKLRRGPRQSPRTSSSKRAKRPPRATRNSMRIQAVLTIGEVQQLVGDGIVSQPGDKEDNEVFDLP
jgi:hypothetical protein